MTRRQDDIIGSSNILTEQQRRTLFSLLDMIIPASDDGRMPGANELDLLAYVRDESGALITDIAQGLTALNQQAVDQCGQEFQNLSNTDKQHQLDTIKASQPNFIQTLQMQTVVQYYQNDRVISALGLEPRPPYPKGHEVEAGDLSLLDPVRQGPKRYRE